MERGKLIYIEGGEGSGKGVHTKWMKEYLFGKGIRVLNFREPGGEPLAEVARKMVLNPNYDWTDLSEIYLFQIARTELYQKSVIPALLSGSSVIQDRSKISSLAYQGYGAGGDINLIKLLNKKSTFGYEPDLVFIIDVDPLKGLEKEVIKDRMSKKGLEFHRRVRKGFLEIARENPDNFVIIPYVENGIDKMRDKMKEYLDGLYGF